MPAIFLQHVLMRFVFPWKIVTSQADRTLMKMSITDAANRSAPVEKTPALLIVEDDPDVGSYIGEVLSDDYQVAYAANGAEALIFLENHPVDLIISDIGMPHIDGLELLRRIREERQELVPVLFLTAHKEQTEVIQALLLGVDAYVTKPFESDELRARVHGLLMNDRLRKAAYAVYSTGDNDALAAAEPEDLDLSDVSFRVRWLKELEAVVEKEIGNPGIKVPDLAYKMALCERTFRKRIRLFTGFSPIEYLMEARMIKALRLLENKVYATVAEVVYAVGLNHAGYFSIQFRKRFGKYPSEYM